MVKAEIKNIEEFKELLEKYKLITKEDIDLAYERLVKDKVITYSFGSTIMQDLTGFGDCNTCTLCLAVTNQNNLMGEECIYCVYNIKKKKSSNGSYACLHGESEPSYDAITQSYDSKALLKAIKNRIKFMKSLKIK